MFVVKRKGTTEPANFGKIQQRLQWLKEDPVDLPNVNDAELAQMVIKNLRNNMHTSEIDNYSATLCASLSTVHTDYGILAGRIAINNHHKNTLNSFRDKIDCLYLRKDWSDHICPLVTDEFYKFVKKHHFEIDKAIDYNRDYLIDFFGFKTLENGYMIKVNDKTIERPQDTFMRVAIQLHMNTDKDNKKVLDRIFNTYDSISQKYYTHATPTLFNAGTPKGNLSSCFLLGTEDSREGILKTLNDCTLISKWSGGIGVHVSNWRAKDSLIRGTNGKSSGIIPFLRMYNDGARAFNQGGKRNGSFAVYLEPHHPDVMQFLEMRKNQGDENLRCRDLFMAIWISDLFMRRVKSDATWSFFCPDKCPDLNTSYGDEYDKLYIEYEQKGLAHSTVKARDVWKCIFESQKESGMPYICYKDTVNRSNMHDNIGTIQSSNLCSEIMLHSDSNNYSVCNLASLCLPNFVEDTYSEDELELPEEERRPLDHEFPTHPIFNYKKLLEITGDLVVNLNNVIDKNWNPLIETARSNFKNRPIGIGVQGLADVFSKFRIPFDSDEAYNLNKKISESIYYAALSKSTELSRDIWKSVRQQVATKPYTHNIYPREVKSQFPDLRKEDEKVVYSKVEDVPQTIGTYPTYLENGGSPLARGVFHWELYGLTNDDLSGAYDWETLRHHIKTYGVRNSHLVALMPTASTSQIMGCSSCFEPYISNIYRRKTLAGEFIIVNKYLIHDLQKYGLWGDQMKQYLILNNGSVQNIDGIPDHMKQLYKTVWEIKQKSLVKLAAGRQPFVDQSQSMNLHFEDFTFNKFNSVQFYAWEKKLKTGCYYLRSRPAITAQKFTIDPELQKKIEKKELILQSQIQNASKISSEPDMLCLLCGS